VSLRYDADAPVDADTWLAHDEDDRLRAVLRHHRGRVERLHDRGYDRQLHARLHLIVENQLADGQPATFATVERLCDAGLRRHVAVHMVIEALIQQIADGVDFDDEAWARRLAALQPGEWLGDRMRRDLA
jgi:hypothetical protein